MRTKKMISMLLVMVLLISGCLSVSPATAEAAAKKTVKSVTLRIKGKNVTKKTYSMKTGGKVTLAVRTTPAAAKKTVKYSTSNAKVAKVNGKGRITAVGKGTAKIKVTTGGKYKKKTAWVKVRVTKKTGTKTSEKSGSKASDSSKTDNGTSGLDKTDSGTDSAKTDSGTSNGTEGNDNPAANYGKTLIVYFSWSSNTEKFAEYIHDTIGGDIERIAPVMVYSTDYSTLADYAKNERDTDARPEFQTLAHNPEDYDTVIVGYPIWWYTLPMIMYTFFDTYDLSGKTIVPFNTHAGSGDGGTYDTIKGLEPKATVTSGLAIAGSQIEDGSSKTQVQSWLEQLGFSQ